VRRPHRTWPQRLLLTLNIALVLVCLTAAGGIYWTYNQASALPRIDVGASLSPSSEPGEPQNILLVGIDDGTGLQADDPVLRGRPSTLNTDTVMILRIDPKTQQAAILSLPRDLYVDLAGGGKGRINTALALGGPERLIETIKQDFGIPINHYAMVDFHGFEALVSSVGGVPVYFNYPSRDENTGLFQYEPGCVTLDGDQALAYVRSRHFEIQRTANGKWQEDPSSDFGRINRQQQFIKAALRKAVAKGVRNPFVLKDLVGIAQKNVTLDTEFSIQDLVDLGQQFRDFDPDQLVSYTPPANGRMVGAMSVLILDDAGSQPIFDVFRGVSPIPSDPAAATSTTEAPTTVPTTTVPAPSTTLAPVTTTTLSDFLPQAPEGETCG
jgi:polyisoprenyl-teichoic acid--peptidoglycan teichoic acid transferase